MLRFGLLTESRDHRRLWSGTVNAIVEALRAQGVSIDVLPPVLPRATHLAKSFGRMQQMLGGPDPALVRTEWMARLKARTIHGLLATRDDIDALLAPAGSTMLPFVRPGIPIIYVSDATFPLMADYYERYARLTRGTRARAFALERRALRRVDLAVFPTKWAADSARRLAGIPAERIVIAPFGANIGEPPARDAILRPRAGGPLRLLFCAVEWERKGGDIAVEAAAWLAKHAVDAELTILGVTPPSGTPLPANVRVIPYLDKNKPEDARRFREVFAEADLFLMPTRAECYGLVFCEAAAYGTPSLATDTGGVPEVVRHGDTGLLLPPTAGGAEYGRLIAELSADPGRLAAMRLAARDDFETRLNWTVWARTVSERARSLVEARHDVA